MWKVWDQSPAATLYVYDSNSAFSNVMNKYMSYGSPVIPISSSIGQDVLGNATLDYQTADVIAKLTATLPRTEYKLLDSQ